jgi:hypothetical protein
MKKVMFILGNWPFAHPGHGHVGTERRQAIITSTPYSGVPGFKYQSGD